MVIYTINWTAHEAHSYLGGVLSAHKTMRLATAALVKAAENLEKENWVRQDNGIALEAMRTCPPTKRSQLRYYQVSYEQRTEGEESRRKMDISIEMMEVEEENREEEQDGND